MPALQLAIDVLTMLVVQCYCQTRDRTGGLTQPHLLQHRTAAEAQLAWASRKVRIYRHGTSRCASNLGSLNDSHCAFRLTCSMPSTVQTSGVRMWHSGPWLRPMP